MTTAASSSERNAFWDMESDFGGGAGELAPRAGMDALLAEVRKAAGLPVRQRAERPIIDCPKCRGRGEWFHGLECLKCHGTGKVHGLLQDEASVKRRQKAAERRSGVAAPVQQPVRPDARLSIVAGRTGAVVLDGGRLVAKSAGGRVFFVRGTPVDVMQIAKRMLTGG
jgi:hypothetical protein